MKYKTNIDFTTKDTVFESIKKAIGVIQDSNPNLSGIEAKSSITSFEKLITSWNPAYKYYVQNSSYVSLEYPRNFRTMGVLFVESKEVVDEEFVFEDINVG